MKSSSGTNYVDRPMVKAANFKTAILHSAPGEESGSDGSSTYASSDDWSDDNDEDLTHDMSKVITVGSEATLGKPLLKASRSTPSLSAIMKAKQMARLFGGGGINRNSLFPERGKVNRCSSISERDKINRSSSVPRMGITCVIQTISAQKENNQNLQSNKSWAVSPAEHLTKLLLLQGIQGTTYSASALSGFFLNVSKAHIDAYSTEVVSAFRNNDINAIKSFHQKGKLLQCCNKFGESVVHLACRRGSYEILKFLTSEANVSIRVRCDAGRTPLHDACWTNRPNFDLVRLLIIKCPDLLSIKDNRGFTPLSYVPRNSWELWCNFLDKNKDILRPRDIIHFLKPPIVSSRPAKRKKE